MFLSNMWVLNIATSRQILRYVIWHIIMNIVKKKNIAKMQKKEKNVQFDEITFPI